MKEASPFWCYEWHLLITFRFVSKSYIEETYDGYANQCDTREKMLVSEDYRNKTVGKGRVLKA